MQISSKPLQVLAGIAVVGGLLTLAWSLYDSEPAEEVFEIENAEVEVVEEILEPAYLETMERGQENSDYEVITYDPEKAYNGTTMFADKIPETPRIIELNMLGEIMWEYQNPEWGTGGSIDDVEWIPESDTVIFMYHNKGHILYEIDRAGNVLFEYKDSQADHDIDKLENGNYLYVYGMGDTLDDPIVKEVSPDGEIVWEWYLKDHLDPAIYEGVEDEGVAHANAVIRLENGHTLISPRNFNLIIEVDASGEVVDLICEDVCAYQHDPELLGNGNILMANQETQGHEYELGDEPQRALEIDTETGETIWENLIVKRTYYPLRDADRLPNGNTLITGSQGLFEVTPDGEIVWQLDSAFDITFAQSIYKAQRIF